MSRVTFQSLIFELQSFWAERGCVIEQPVDVEVGAGTFHPATFLRVLGPEPWNVGFVQPSPPARGRPLRREPEPARQHYQFQVILKPAPLDVQELYLDSLRALGLDPPSTTSASSRTTGSRPTLGAWGLGWEVWCDGMEITQFTYFQQAGGIDLHAGLRRAHLRARADLRCTCRTSRARVRHRVGDRRHVRRGAPAERGRVLASTTSRVADVDAATCSCSTRTRASARRCSRRLLLPAYD